MTEQRNRTVKRPSQTPPPVAQVPPTILSAAKAMAAVARKRGVEIREKELAFVATNVFTIAHVPVAGLERYTDADFAKGVPIQVIVIHARVAGKLPNGTYLVMAQARPGATDGKVSFITADGTVAAQRDLIIRAQKQTAVVFPDVYSKPPSEIPVITSTHLWLGDQTHMGDPKYGHWGVDCSGWQPFRTLYYWSD